jgi:hypothetical protein
MSSFSTIHANQLRSTLEAEAVTVSPPAEVPVSPLMATLGTRGLKYPALATHAAAPSCDPVFGGHGTHNPPPDDE